MKFAHKGLNLFLVLLLIIGSVCLPAAAAPSGSEAGEAEASLTSQNAGRVLTVEPSREAYQSGETLVLKAYFGTAENPANGGIQWYYALESGEEQSLEEDSAQLSFVVPENPGESELEITVSALWEGETQQAVLRVLPEEEIPGLKSEAPELIQENTENQGNEENPAFREPLTQETPQAQVTLESLGGQELILSSPDEHNQVQLGGTLPLIVHDQAGHEVTTSSALVWTSQVPEIAAVGSSGAVTGKLAGIVYITAALQENPEVRGSLAVTVGDSLDPEPVIVARMPANNQNNVYPGYNPREVSLTYNRPIDGEETVGAFALYLSTGSLISSSLPVAWDRDNPNKLSVNLSKTLWSEAEPGSVTLAFNKTYRFEAGAGAVPIAGSGKQSPAITGTVSSNPNAWFFKTGNPISLALSPSGSNARPASLKVGQKLTLTATISIPNPVPPETEFRLDWQSENPQAVPADGTEQYTPSTNAQGLVSKITVTKELTGQDLGKVKLTAALRGMPAVSKDWYVEVQAKYDQKLAPLWTYSVPTPYQGYGKPAVTADGSSYTVLTNIYDVSQDGDGKTTQYLLALDPEGKPKEGFTSPTLTQMFPAVIAEQEGQEYVLAVREKSLLALDPDTGSVVRQVDLPSPIMGMPGLGPQGQVYLSCRNNALYSLDLSGGQWTWSFPVVEPIVNTTNGMLYSYSAPTIDLDNQVYLVHGDTLSVLKGLSGELLWEYKAPAAASFKTQVSVDEGGRVYLTDSADQIYCLSPPDGDWPVGLVWRNSSCHDVMVFPPLILPDGLLVSSDGRLAELELDTGELKAKSYAIDYSLYVLYPQTGPDPQLGADGLIYTTKGIYDSDGTVVAYYAEANPAFPTYGYSMFKLSEDGTLYRAVADASTYYALERARLYDVTGAVPVRLVSGQSQLTLYSGETGRIQTQVLDGEGVSLPGVTLEWSSADSQVASVSSDGLITAAQRGADQEPVTTAITVKVKDSTDPALSQTIEVTVLPQAVPASMVFVFDENVYTGRTVSDYEPVGETLSEVQGEAFRPIRVFVADQSGFFVPKELINWELIKDGDETGNVAMLNYQGGSGDMNIRYNANLTGTALGTLTLKASLISNPEIYCRVKLEVLPAPYEILWQIPIGGSYGKKVAQLAAGRNGEIFSVSQNQLQAVRQSDGALLWTADPGSYYGITLSAPQVDEEGNVFLYASNTTAVVAVEGTSGQTLWGFTAPGSDPVTRLVLTEDRVLALAQSGRIYELDKGKGSLLRSQPFAAGGEVSGLAAVGDKVFYSLGAEVYEIGDNGEGRTLYSQSGSVLKLEGSSPQGALILQEQKGSQVSLLSLDPAQEDPLEWTYPLAEAVTVTIAEDGMIYAVSAPADREEKHLYFLRSDGTPQADGVFQAEDWGDGDQGLYTPVAGGDGRLYIPLVGLYVFNQDLSCEKGDILTPLWKAEIKDEFSECIPRSMAVSGEGVVYLSMGEMGLLALRGTDLAGGEGLELKVSHEALKPGRLQELKIKLINHEGEACSLRLTVTLLEGAEGEQVLSYSSLTDSLDSGAVKEYPGSVRIPGSGSFRIKIQAAVPDQPEARQTILLPVQAQ
ncbi:PQQ-binding-like beta-propeller repeat protein [Desulfosporosinus meridiei]|uniref:WD40-like repeat protein n=1 Tax=Desulfosporosinus meridiei (strain ATCC BAA-275 / DSM 13257 / KCTC 12902 / NCIMB 13706 / S10) TaxID=768704 RepID=J7IV90_DESMD|nr:PQQ-binding-like beta-propeller repeat protein [Desulfosporosinus meridiei]AFQ42626.1 WD40-like repeat protein [Desulfosporosinus meridiei DSM 13257]